MDEDSNKNIKCRLINEGEECVICLEDLVNNIVLLSCRHEYHYDCIQQWFFKKKYLECPLCRRTVEIENIFHSTMEVIPHLLLNPSVSSHSKSKCCIIL